MFQIKIKRKPIICKPIFSCMYILLAVFLYFASDYMHKAPLTVTVADKLVLPGSRSSLGSPVIVYERLDGYRFDSRTSVATYTHLQKGDRVNLNIRPMDVKQSSSENLFFFFLPILFMALGIVTLFTNVQFRLTDNKHIET